MDITNLSVPLISRNNKKGTISPGLTKEKKNRVKRVLTMLQPSLEDANLRKTHVKMTLRMMNCWILM